MNTRKRLRNNREAMRNDRHIKAMLAQHTDTDGHTDMVGMNNQLHLETKNPTMEEFFGAVGIDIMGTD